MVLRLWIGCLAAVVLSAALPALAQEVQRPTTAAPPLAVWRRPAVSAGLVSVGVVAGCAANSFLDNPEGDFRVEDEGWFGQSTYAGGADKASHFVSFELMARELGDLYGLLGVAPVPAHALAAGVSLLSGLIVELGDGTNQYGRSSSTTSSGSASVSFRGRRRRRRSPERVATTRTRSTPPI